MTPVWSIHPAASLAAMRSEWDELVAGVGAIPFLETAFLIPLIESFGAGTERLALARRDGKLVAAAILAPHGIGRWQTFQPSQLPLGPWLALAGEDGAALACSLISTLPGLNVGVGLTQLDPRFSAQVVVDPRLRKSDYIDTAWVDVDGTFDDYWASRGKNLRTNVRKQRTKLEADGVGIEFSILTRTDDVAAAIAEYARLEASGWKAENGTAVSEENAQSLFYRRMLENFSSDGRAEIWRCAFNGSAAAMDLCITAGDTLVILKTAFDAQHKSISPATLLHHDAFKRIFDERAGIRRIEFYGRVMEWHTRWTSNVRQLFHLTAFRWAGLHAVRERIAALRATTAAATATHAPAEQNA